MAALAHGILAYCICSFARVYILLASPASNTPPPPPPHLIPRNALSLSPTTSQTPYATLPQVHSTRFGEDDAKSLQRLNFQTGDFMSVAIY
jgi:hypothetical protein